MNSATPGLVWAGAQVSQAVPKVASVRADAGRLDVAESLHKEFSAPVGILDGERRLWTAAVGAEEPLFPRVDASLLEVIGAARRRSGKVAIWRQPQRPFVQWLVLPLSTKDAVDLVVFAGFRSSASSDDAQGLASDHETRAPGETVSWGPRCPDQALLAWGQQALSRIQEIPGTRHDKERHLANEDESDHGVIGRLIRRMRISEPPRHFQALATNVLKASLGMAAAAWIPADTRDEIVVSGSIEGLRPSSYRDLIPAGTRDSSGVSGESRIVSTGSGSGPVRRYASVAAGSAGWLIALNPSGDRPIGTPEIERMQYVASLIATQANNARIYAELKELLFGIIRALTAAIDAKDPYTSGHSERVARIAVRLAEELGIPPPKRSDLYLAGLLHDIGKIGIDDVVLKKTGPLTQEEYRKIQAHVEIGVTILKDLKKLSHIIPGVRHHHESLDGSGYPDHLSGDDIPLEARVLAVADSFDAMSSNRPYRKRLSPMQIDEILRKGRGTQWDPNVIDALFACRMDVEAIRQKGLGESLIGAVNLTLGRG
jgi:putative nucleotidyltransferase with HDIG domain